VAPIEVMQQVVGVLCATDRAGGGSFDESDLALLRILALQIGQVLTQQQTAHAPAPATPVPGGEVDLLADEPEEDDAAAQLVREVCEGITSEIEPARILQAVLRPIAAALHADPVSLYLRDPASGDLVLEGEAGEGGDRARLAPGRGISGSVLASGRLVASPEPDRDPRFDAAQDTPGSGARAPLLCLPLRFRGKVLGLVRAFQRPGEAPCARTGELLAAALSAAARNVLLYRSLLESIEDVAQARREAQPAPAAEAH
jgi:GAF domain-containing protein